MAVRWGTPEDWERPLLRALGAELKQARLRAGMTRRELADAMGMHRESVRRMELGAMRPRRNRLWQWAVATLGLGQCGALAGAVRVGGCR